MFKYQPGQIVSAKNSGKLYKIERQRSDNHRKLKGEIGYNVVGQRDGKNFGPTRLMPESSLLPCE